MQPSFTANPSTQYHVWMEVCIHFPALQDLIGDIIRSILKEKEPTANTSIKLN